MGRYHLGTGKTWKDDDLIKPHEFGTTPQWKNEPLGIPTVYKLRATDAQLDKLDNPYEHITKQKIKTI
jgi:hypothetical protein